MKLVLAFDRDGTIDSSPDPGPIPLAWLPKLAEVAHVYAIGNPLLGPEAGIPDHHEIKRRAKTLKYRVIEPDWSVWTVVPEDQRDNIAGKFRRLSRLSAIHPNMLRLSIDDYPLYRMPGWTYWTPSGFFRQGLDHWLRFAK